MAFLLPLLLRALPFIAAAALAWYGWHRVDNWCNSACVEQRTQLGNARTQIGIAQARATALALLWAEAINRVEVRYVEVVRARTDAVAGVRERAGRIRSDTDRAHLVVSRDALGVLHDAERIANDTAPAAGDSGPGQAVSAPAGPAETTLTDWLEFAINAAEAYRDAEDKHLACVAAYEAIRNGQTEAAHSSGP